MHTKTIFTIGAIWIASLLGACSAQPEPTSTLAPSPLPTETRTPEPSSTWTPEPSSTTIVTVTPTPISVLVSLKQFGGDGLDELDYCLRAYSPAHHFLLYEDGFLVHYSGSFKFVQLSQEETDDLLQKIERMGFFDIEGNGDLREKDPIYTYDFEQKGYIGDGGYSSTISILDNKISLYAPLGEYLIEPVRNTYDLLQTYSHVDEIPFIPNRLVVYMLPNIESYTNSEDLQDALGQSPSNTQSKWPDNLPAIESFYNIFEGKNISNLLEVLPRIPSYGIFTEGENTSFVFACFPER